MSITKIHTDELRRMNGREGLVLQGCGGDLSEWQDGINELLTEAGILLDNTRFDNIYVFQRESVQNILFPFDGDTKLDMGKLAMWRLQNPNFEGMWLSDYVNNRLGGFVTEELQAARQKPDCPLIGQDGNIFNLMGIAARTLRRNRMPEQANEMCERIRESGSYAEALNIIGEYVNITSAEESEKFREGMDLL